MCVSKQYSACCTIWCAFGTVILTLFYILGHYDGVCEGENCIGNFFIVDMTGNLTSPQAGDVCGLAALGYLFFSLMAGGFWVYYDFVKKPKRKRNFVDEEVEFSDLGNNLLSNPVEGKEGGAEI